MFKPVIASKTISTISKINELRDWTKVLTLFYVIYSKKKERYNKINLDCKKLKCLSWLQTGFA